MRATGTFALVLVYPIPAADINPIIPIHIKGYIVVFVVLVKVGDEFRIHLIEYSWATTVQVDANVSTPVITSGSVKSIL